MRFKCRFHNSLAQGLSVKNEQHVRPPWREASRGAGHNAAVLDASAWGRPWLHKVKTIHMKAKWFQPRIPSWHRDK